MHPILKNSIAIVLGLFIGGSINMGIIMISGSVIPPPEGVDMTTMEGLKESMHLMEPKHFLMPFLAHAVGTFAGALIAAFIASTHKMKFALAIGIFFLAGGITNVILLPSPLWFSSVDLILAYIPLAMFAGKIATKSSGK